MLRFHLKFDISVEEKGFGPVAVLMKESSSWVRNKLIETGLLTLLYLKLREKHSK